METATPGEVLAHDEESLNDAADLVLLIDAHLDNLKPEDMSPGERDKLKRIFNSTTARYVKSKLETGNTDPIPLFSEVATYVDNGRVFISSSGERTFHVDNSSVTPQQMPMLVSLDTLVRDLEEPSDAAHNRIQAGSVGANTQKATTSSVMARYKIRGLQLNVECGREVIRDPDKLDLAMGKSGIISVRNITLLPSVGK